MTTRTARGVVSLPGLQSTPITTVKRASLLEDVAILQQRGLTRSAIARQLKIPARTLDRWLA